ncbi:MAG TPA: hypothetical protein VGG57_07270 [Stellaceae bacterium]|jgi:hypothetical protein
MHAISSTAAGLGAALVASMLTFTAANASTTHQELVALTGGANNGAVTLPEVTISPAAPSGVSLYDTGHSPKVSSEHYIQPSHYQVPAGYDGMVAMHPYTSGMGVCTEAASPAQGCSHPTGTPIPASHYDRVPFDQ